MSVFILLIEDNPGDAIIFREKLNASDLDYKLATAKRLSEGLDRIAETDFDIILVDLSLPDAQGLEAVTQVRTAAPDRPLIVLTGLDDATAAAEAKEQGAVDYLVKWYVDSVSLARYIRYAIAQYKMFNGGPADTEGFGERPQRPASRRGRVVEGELIVGEVSERSEARREERSAAGRPQPDPPAVEADDEEDIAPAASLPPETAPVSEALREAIAGAGAALLVVRPGGEVVYATNAARAWVPDDRLPWPLEDGTRTTRGGTDLRLRVNATTWAEQEAYLVQLHETAPAEPAASAERARSDVDLLYQTSETALAFAEQSVRRNRWMADVLRSALDMHRIVAGEVSVQPGDINLLDVAEQVARAQRELAMSYGLPLRTTSVRKKVMAYADRNVVGALLNRVVTDAVHAAGSDGVEVEVRVEKQESVVESAWHDRVERFDPASEACFELGHRMAKRLAALCDGTAAHTQQEGGRHLLTVRLPCRTSAGGGDA